MTKLALGVLLWSIVHLFPAFAAGFRKSMIDRLGVNPWKGIFTLFVIASLYLIISGWKGTTAEEIYLAPAWGEHLSYILVLIGFILFGAPYPRNNFKRIMRHPQLIGTILWSVGHLVAIGTQRSILLFGGLAVWAVLEILLINRRDGDWVKPEAAPFRNDVSLVLFAALVYAGFLFTHHLLFGGSPLTGETP